MSINSGINKKQINKIKVRKKTSDKVIEMVLIGSLVFLFLSLPFINDSIFVIGIFKIKAIMAPMIKGSSK
ncbi:MAG: hypothetical protein BHW64_06665 [Candidatus Melainabacteria bacterium LEY3_CP_29_8]|nr:MAG: hypothetical protein BHW64_06665 [Candidatus Melainabacteria bacterium LEY3_CP_29_8]